MTDSTARISGIILAYSVGDVNAQGTLFLAV